MPVDAIRQLRILAIWATALVAAVFLGAASLGAVTKDTAPGIALALSPRNGFAYETEAILAASARGGSIADPRGAAGAAASAREALRREPYASNAVALIALAADARGEADRARRLFERANRLDKREPLSSSWLLANVGNGTGPETALRLIDEALKVRPEIAAQYMPALAQGLAQPGTVPFFRAVLARGPVWADAFWQAVAANPAALDNGVALRRGMLSGRSDLGEIDQWLVRALIEAGRFETAMRFAGATAPADPAAGLVRLPDFRGEPALPPLDWELVTDGRIGASIDSLEGVLQITALPGAGGVVARQLVELPPGDYLLRAKLATAAMPEGAEIILHLRCALTDSAEPPLLEPMAGDADARITVARGDCRYRWLEVEISALNASNPVIARLADLRILPDERLR